MKTFCMLLMAVGLAAPAQAGDWTELAIKYLNARLTIVEREARGEDVPMLLDGQGVEVGALLAHDEVLVDLGLGKPARFRVQGPDGPLESPVQTWVYFDGPDCTGQAYVRNGPDSLYARTSVMNGRVFGVQAGTVIQAVQGGSRLVDQGCVQENVDTMAYPAEALGDVLEVFPPPFRVELR